MSDDKRFFTKSLEDAEALTGISVRSLKVLIEKGKIEAARPTGKELVVYWQSLQDHIARTKVKPKAS